MVDPDREKDSKTTTTIHCGIGIVDVKKKHEPPNSCRPCVPEFQKTVFGFVGPSRSAVEFAAFFKTPVKNRSKIMRNTPSPKFDSEFTPQND